MEAQFIESIDDVRRLVQLNVTTESLHLEFKLDLDRYRAENRDEQREGRKEFCRDVCAFANAYGGCLLVGVQEGPGQGARVAAFLRGIDDFDRRREWMETAIRDFLVPNGFGIRISRVQVEDKTLIAVNIPPSERTVLVWDPRDRTSECYRRTNHGKGEGLHPDQVEANAASGRRTAELMLRRVIAELHPSTGTLEAALASGVWAAPELPGDALERIPARVSLWETRENDFALGLLIANELPIKTVRVPYELLRAAWPTIDRKVGLFLQARVVYRDDDLGLEPF